jgi:hypothetical protein
MRPATEIFLANPTIEELSEPITFAEPYERWRGSEPWGIRYIMLDDNGNYASMFTCAEAAAFPDAEAEIWERLAEEHEYRRLPECVAPGCSEKGPLIFHAAASGRLAGRDWTPGDAINLCPKHAHDVYMVVPGCSVEDLAEWLRPDARRDAFDTYDRGRQQEWEKPIKVRCGILPMRDGREAT